MWTFLATKAFQFLHGDGRRKKSKTGEDGTNHTAQVGPGDGGRKKSKKRNEFNLDLISKTFFLSRNELARPVMGTILLVIYKYLQYLVCKYQYVVFYMKILPQFNITII